MTAPIDFFISGTPAPGGSKTAFPMRRRDGSLVLERRGPRQLLYPLFNMVDAGGDNLKEWRKAVRRAALAAFPYSPLEGHLRVVVRFYLERPQAHYVCNDRTRPLKEWALDALPTVKPDATKLWRGTEDELTGVLWKDDSQVTDPVISKRYAGPGQPTGARIKVTLPILDEVPDPSLLEAACSNSP